MKNLLLLALVLLSGCASAQKDTTVQKFITTDTVWFRIVIDSMNGITTSSGCYPGDTIRVKGDSSVGNLRGGGITGTGTKEDYYLIPEALFVDIRQKYNGYGVWIFKRNGAYPTWVIQ